MNRRKTILQKIIDYNPQAQKTSGKYRAIKAMIIHMYPDLGYFPMIKATKTRPEVPARTGITEDIIYDIVNADRDWRKLTEHLDTEEKEVMSQEWQLENGYEADYQNVRCK